jgi:large conductance mechanosensitive channel
MTNPLRSLAAEFRAFLARGNVMELAVAFMLGAAFGDVVKSAAGDLLAPIIGVMLGDLNFVDYFTVLKEGKAAGPYPTLEAARAAGAVTLNWGQFVTRVISFIITASVLFAIVRAATALQRRQRKADDAAAPATKECQFCFSNVPVPATRCPQCTSQLQAGAAAG